MDFVHLHTHTEHSMLDGLSKVTRKFVDAVAQQGQNAVAITDHGSLAGALRLAHAAQGTGVKPILGMEAYVAIGSRHERNSIEIPRDDGDANADLDVDPEAFKRTTTAPTKRKMYEHLTVLAHTPPGMFTPVLTTTKNHCPLCCRECPLRVTILRGDTSVLPWGERDDQD